jgi:hypothetical protein
MTKTAKDIQTDIIALLGNSALSSAISGSIYRKGYRPRGSQEEDIEVVFMAGRTNQIQIGTVLVQIYVPDVDPYDNGVMVEDGARTAALERLAQTWIESVSPSATNYKLQLNGTIKTDYDEDIKQHFVVVMIDYEYFD